MDTKMIGSKIAEARKKLNISQAELAQRLFISAQAVGKWERGESIPDLIMFNRLAKILGVDVNYFSEDFPSIGLEKALTDQQIKPPAEILSGRQKDKPGWDMSRENWADADFSGLKNLHEKFNYSNMQRCRFIGSDMRGLHLKSNNVDRCDFSGSNLSGCHIQSSNIAKSIFKDCLLKETEFSSSFIYGCDFSGSDCSGVVVRSGGFEKNTTTNTVWNRSSFIDTALANIVFEGTLEDCSFENCAFTRVTFRNGIIKNTFFKNKSLKRVRFIDCQADRITYAFLKNGKADLSGITLLTS